MLIFLFALIVLFRNRSPFGKRETNFSAGPGREITAIGLSGEDKSVTLSLENGEWKVNRTGEVRKNSVEFFIRVLAGLKIKSPLSPEMFDSVVVSENIRPVRVRVYSKRRILSSFIVYRTASNMYGNIMKVSEKKKPFIVHFPGFEGDIGSLFNPDELYWRPYTLFNLLPSEISSVTLESNTDPASSFSINVDGNTYNLSDMINSLSGWDTSRIRRYISYFTLVQFESWAFDMDDSVKEQLTRDVPAYRISVTDAGGKKADLELWERFIDGKKDTGRLWGKVNGQEEFMIIRYFDIDPLLRKLNYFFPENE